MMFDKLIHKYLKVPYALNLAVKRRGHKARATVLFLHGIGQKGEAWQGVIDLLPNDIRVISLDLLGFGGSPKPHWAEYSAEDQARSVAATLLRSLPKRPLIIVGHSLGALVSVELSKRYSKHIDYLILCSPPFYRQDASNLIIGRDKRLKSLYRMIQGHPERFVEAAHLAAKYKLVPGPININNDNIASYMSALEASIINQTSLEDAKHISIPMRVIHGALDPLVIKKNLKHLTRHNPNADLRTITAGHEVKSKTYTKTVTEEIIAAVDDLCEKATKIQN